MKRRALQLCFALGLLLTLTAAGLWARGVWVTDTFRAYRVRQAHGVRTGDLILAAANARRIVVDWERTHGTVRVPPHAGVAPVRSAKSHTTIRGGRDHERYFRDPSPGTFWQRVGFHRVVKRATLNVGRDYVGPGEYRRVCIMVPTWLMPLSLAALTAAPAAYVLRDRRRRRRAAHGLCVTCGYDLRGADHERCPECGASIAVAAI